MSATRTYSPLPPMIPAGDIFWTNPCILREPDPCPHTYGVRVGLCAAFATEPCRPTACTGEGSFAVVGIAHRPFRHTHSHPRPRPTTTVWRNLQQHPQCDIATTTLHSPFSILHSSFSQTFSAKERDTETGLSYFGSRYYSSDLSIWLSVDPMSAKYPSLSPYVYCANNPVKLVDPNGEDWYVNQDGNIVEGTNKDDHTLYAVKGKKNEFGDRLIYRRGDQKGKEVSMPVDDEIMRSFKTDENGYSQMDLTGKEESGLEMMRFFSRHTNVEWSFWGGNTWDKESETESAFATIGTSHSYSKDEFSTIPILNASRKLGERHTTPLRFFIHTHPHQEIWGTWASRNDRKIKECCEICSPSAQFGIMHRGILYDYENNRIKISF